MQPISFFSSTKFLHSFFISLILYDAVHMVEKKYQEYDLIGLSVYV